MSQKRKLEVMDTQNNDTSATPTVLAGNKDHVSTNHELLLEEMKGDVFFEAEGGGILVRM